MVQDDESALLQQAIAMSVDNPDAGQSTGIADANMSDADDQDLAIGECWHTFWLSECSLIHL